MKFNVACIQLNSQDNIKANIAAIAPLIAQAAGQGAEFLLLPENAFLMRAPGAPRQEPLQEQTHAGVQAAKAWARAHNVWILVGSVQVALENAAAGALPVNRSLLISPGGEVIARYDKIHLFDVKLPNGETYAESGKCSPGHEAVVASWKNIPVGLTICYDVRFAHLYRALAKAGAEILTVPAAFTHTTGKAHWHVLLRARAIENGCFVLAPAQCGIHPGGRKTYGHSLIIDPWGEILAEGGEDAPGVIMATIDLAQVALRRAQLPSLTHDRDFGIPAYAGMTHL